MIPTFGVPEALNRPRSLIAALAAALLVLLAQHAGGAASAGLRPMERAALSRALAVAPRPLEGAEATALLAPGAAAGPRAAGLQQQSARLYLDDFERDAWPQGSSLNPAATWIPDSLTDLLGGAFGYHWATSDCRARAGQRSLCATCGGTGGSQLRCGDAYPDGVAGSVLLRLDLGPWRQMDQLDLVMDIWAEAEPHEGLIVNYLDYAPDGSLRARHPIHSATGQLADWARDQRIDLLSVQDELDPNWTRNLAGQIVLLELLFVSADDGGNGEGIYLDDLALDLQAQTVVVTPEPSSTPTASATPPNSPTPSATPGPPASPTPTDRTVYCPAGQTCGRLRVEAYVDLRCDGRYHAGVDSWVAGRRVDVDAGGVGLGTTLSRNGSAYFLLPTRSGIEVRFELPPGYRMCANSSNPKQLDARDFGRFGNEQVDFRIVRER